MVRSTFAVVAAAVAAPSNGEDRFTNLWDDSAWTTTSSPSAVTTLPPAATPPGAVTDGEAGLTGLAAVADPLTPVNHPTN
jgi:hypothetical protein